jgi:hypothetical protein
VQFRDYAGPLGILAAGVVGFGLLCSVSAVAMGDLSSRGANALQPINILDLAVSNLSTSAALTEQAVTAFVPTPTVVPSNTALATPLPSDTATVRASFTARPPTRTRLPRPAATATPLPTRTRTPIPAPTDTPLPTSTSTPVPTDTPFPPPPTDTPPPPTDTPLPPPTDTAVPPTLAPVLDRAGTQPVAS